MTRFLFALCTVLCAFSASAEVLIIHEQRIQETWTLDITWLNDASEIGDAVIEIDTHPDKRRGPSFVVLGGIRLSVESIETPGPAIWEASDEQAGSYVVFWNVRGSSNPADWHADSFPDLAGAEAFINDVKADDSRELWDERPLKVERTWKAVAGEPLIKWVLVP